MGSLDPQNDDCTADSVRPTIQLVKVLLCRYFGRAYRPHNDPFSELPLLISCGAFFHSLILLFFFLLIFFINYFHFYGSAYRYQRIVHRCANNPHSISPYMSRKINIETAPYATIRINYKLQQRR